MHEPSSYETCYDAISFIEPRTMEALANSLEEAAVDVRQKASEGRILAEPPPKNSLIMLHTARKRG